MLRLTAHAAERLRQRGIPLAWVEAVLAAPEQQQPDPSDPSLTRSWRAIPEAGGRILRVVHRSAGEELIVITAFLDRDAA